MLTSPLLGGGKKEREGKGENPFTPAQGLLNGIPYAD
jgi:hypothetical protein